MRIVFATAEVSPIAKTGGLGDVCGSLPKALRKLGHEVVVFTPWYRQSREWFARTGHPIEELLPARGIHWANWAAEAGFLRSTLPGTDIPLIFVANNYFFDREQIYSSRADGVDDGLHRFTFFCRALIHGCEALGIAPDILHAHDWHTALLPAYLHSGLRGSESFRKTRSVYTIHNLNYQGNAGPEAFPLTGLHSRYWAPDALEHFGLVNPMKGGIILADQVTTVSPTYAREIRTPEHGAGLDGVLRGLSFKLRGILNGIDTEEWDPATDALIPAHYDRMALSGKQASKKALLDELQLPAHDNLPLLGVVSRLVDQKGFQLLMPVLSHLLAAGAQAVVLGSGEQWLEEGFRRIASEFPDRCRTVIGFDNALAHRIYAGADMLLMPSIYEPCGLNQMYALRYGTVPVVRLTGGLVDTVTSFDGTNLPKANGFGFWSADPGDLYAATRAAISTYNDGAVWKALQKNGMQSDFSWERSAREYEQIYRAAG